jgi:hypothetical protein
VAQPSIFAVNTTVGVIALVQLDVSVPTGTGGIDVTLDNTTSEILNDDELNTEVDAGNIVLKIDGAANLTAVQSQIYMRSDGTLQNNVTTTAPGVGDDGVAGYTPRSIWIDTVGGAAYINLANGTGTAVWNIFAFGTGYADPNNILAVQVYS